MLWNFLKDEVCHKCSGWIEVNQTAGVHQEGPLSARIETQMNPSFPRPIFDVVMVNTGPRCLDLTVLFPIREEGSNGLERIH